MNVKIVDTTLRDGEQKPGIALSVAEKVRIAEILDSMGVHQIEAGIPAMGGDEKAGTGKIAELGLKSRISAWNRMNLDDIEQSMQCGVGIIHISVPASDIQIRIKLNRDREWVADNLKRCIYFAKEKGFEVTIGLEDASRADFDFLLQIIELSSGEGVQRVRYADTVGILYRQRVFNEIVRLKSVSNSEIEFHAHNDLGMAVSNSITAAKAGAGFVDCTAGGIGERAGNCNYLHFITAAKACLGIFNDINPVDLEEKQKEIHRIIYSSV